jgi:CheY-like chemotaxis protein
LKILETESVFAVISDICMPGISGLELLAKVKATHPEVFVLLITGQTGKFDKEQAIAAGADGFVAKPFKNIELSQKLCSLGPTNRLERQRAPAV